MKALKCLLVLGIVGLFAVAAAGADQMAQTDQSTQSSQSLTAPIKGKVGYTFMTDYIWHGINLTEVLGGHKGTGASVADYGLGLDLADLSPDYMGTVWVSYQQVYFSQYEDTGAHLAKTDWAVAYSLPCPCLDGDWTFEYRNINFNRVASLKNVDADTQELSAQFGWNDGSFWKCMTGEDMGKKVLYPTIAYMYDADQVEGGLLTIGLSHPFDLADCDPALTGLTLTPSPQLVVDNRYYGGLAEGLNGIGGLDTSDVHRTTKIAYTQLNLDLAANLSKMMGITCGKLTANAGIGYVNSVESFLSDTLYGYGGISFSW